MKQETDLAEKLFGNKRLETGSEKLTTTTIIGKALTDSENGYVEVEYDGNITYGDFQQNIVPTGPNVKAGDTVLITATGGVGKSMSVTNVQGWGDRIDKGILEVSALVAEKADIEYLEAEYAHITDGVIDNAKIDHADVNDLEANYAHITSGVIDNATIGYANVDDLEANYAHITNGVIDNATIDHADVNNLDAEYAHITEGVIDNAKIGYADVNGLNANYAHITNGAIDNATIGYADVNGLNANYAHITNGTIDNAKIGYADVNGLNANYAHITNGAIDNATIGHADVNGLNANYAQIDFENVTNSWIENGVIRNGAIQNEMVQNVSASKLTAGTIDASKINVANLSADNLIVRRINGQPVVGGYTLVGTTSPGYSSKNPSQESWYELSNGTFVLTQDTSVQEGKPYYQEGDEVALYDQTYIDGLKDQLNQRIDGAVETFTGMAVPTLTNYPYNTWYDTSLTPPKDERASHVGDIYFVTNPALDQDGYSYRFAYDNTSTSYMWVLIKDSDVTKALSDITDLQTFESETVSWQEETDEGLTVIRQNHTSLSGVVDKTVKESVQLWFTKANTTAPSKPTAQVTSTSTDGNGWRTVVPSWNASYPNYYYCWQFKLADNTYAWSDVVRDIAMGESQGTSRSAQTTANANIKSSVQLWFTKANSTAPSKPTAQVTTNNAATGNAWNLAVPTYNASYPHYFYCYQQQKGDGTYQWSDVVYDKGTTEAMQKAQAALPSSTFTTFQSTTFKNLVDEVDEQSSTITQMTETVKTGGRNYFSTDYAFSRSATWPIVSKGVTITDKGGGLFNANGTTNATGDCWCFGDVQYFTDGPVAGAGTWTLSITVESGTMPSSVMLQSAVYSGTSWVANKRTASGERSITFTMTAGQHVGDTGLYFSQASVAIDFDFRIKLEKGEIATPWSVSADDVTTTSNTVNQVKQTADANTLSISGLSTIVSNNGLTSTTNITSRASKIEQTLDGFSSTVGAIVDESVVGTNILTGNALNPYNWTISAPTGASYTKTAYGTAGVKVQFSAISGWEWLYSPAITVVSGKKYTLSVEYTVGKDYVISSGKGGYGLSVYKTTPPHSSYDNANSNFIARAQFFETATRVAMKATVTFTASSNTVYLGLNGGQINDSQTGLEFTLDKLTLVENISSRVSTAETSINQTANAIGLTASGVATIANPNLTPFFESAPYRTSTSYDGQYWQPTTDNWLMSGITKLDDGWAHVEVGASKHVEITPHWIEGVDSTKTYTLLIEWKNATVTGSPNLYARNYPASCQFTQNSYHHAWSAGGPSSGVDYVKMTVDTTAKTSSWLAAINLGISNGSGTSFSGDLRLSIYEGEYTGPWKPYSGSQLYASQAELKVANDAISARVEKNGVIASINASVETSGGSAVKISADKVQIDGTAVFNAISTKVDTAITNKGYATTSQAQGYANTAKNDALKALEQSTNMLLDTDVPSFTKVNSSANRYLSDAGNSSYITGEFFTLGSDKPDKSLTYGFRYTLTSDVANRARSMCWAEASPLLKKGATYTCSFWSRVTSGSVKNSVSFFTSSDTNSKVHIVGYRTPTDGWVRESVTFTADADSTTDAYSHYYLYIGVFGNSEAAVVEHCGYRLVEGSGPNADGRNLLALSDRKGGMSLTNKGVSWSFGDDGWITFSGTVTGTSAGLCMLWGSTVESTYIYGPGTYTLSIEDPDGILSDKVRVQMVGDGSQALYARNGYQQLTYAFASGISRVCIFLAANATNTVVSGKLRLKLEKGTVPSSWSKAPEDVQAYVDDMQVGGTNLLAGTAEMKAGAGTYATGTFRASGNCTTSNVTTSGFPVPYVYGAIRVTNGGSSAATVGFCQDSVAGLKVGDTLTQSGWIRASSNQNVYFQPAWSGTGNTTDGNASSPFSVTTEWKRFSFTGVLAGSQMGAYSLGYVYSMDCPAGGWMEVCALKVEKGQKATDWSANPRDQVARTQRIYYRKNASGAPSVPTSWVTTGNNGTNYYDQWTTKVPPIKAETNRYLYLYTCEQSQKGDGTLTHTTVLLDDTTTVIDGGNIITGTVTANKLNANDINASHILTVGAMTTDAQASILNDKLSVGSRNLLIGSMDISTVDGEFGWTSNGNLAEQPKKAYLAGVGDCIYFKKNTTSDKYVPSIVTRNVALVEWGKEYVYGIDIKFDKAITIVANVPNHFHIGSNSNGGYFNTGVNRGADYESNVNNISNGTVIPANTWVHYERRFKWKAAPSDSSYPYAAIRPFVYGSMLNEAAGGVQGWMRNPYVIEANSFDKTTWSPAPEEQPKKNLSPFFSFEPYNTTAGQGGQYWQAFTYPNNIAPLGDGWARITTRDNTSGTGTVYDQHRPKTIPALNPDSTYTLLVEVKNVTKTGTVYLRCPDGGQALNDSSVIFINGYNATIDTPIANGTYHKVFRTAPSSQTNYSSFFGLSTRIDASSKAVYDIRVSVYEGVYFGPYQPYDGMTVQQEQRIYYRSNSTSAPAAPTAFVTSTADANATWTTRRIKYDSTYKYMYTTMQRKRLDGTVSCDPVLLDDTTTVIDGGNIITGSVTANKLNATNINASGVLAIGSLSSDAQAQIGGNGFTILWDSNAATTYGGGEAKLCLRDPLTGTITANSAGWVMWNGVKRTVPNSEFNPNASLPYNIPIYLVLRLSSATSATGTMYAVFYQSGWKVVSAFSSPTTTYGDWTWVEATDIVLGKCVEPASEAVFTECETYEQPRSYLAVTNTNVTAGSANSAAASAQSTANTANSTATTANNRAVAYRGTCSTAANTAAKTVACTNYALAAGATVECYCSTANTAAVPTLNVNSTGAKPIWINGAVASATNPCKWKAGDTVTFTYNTTDVSTGVYRASLPVENYITADSSGIKIHDATNTTNYLYQTSTGTKIYKGGTEVASFAADKIQLGKNSQSSAIEMNGGKSKITARSETIGTISTTNTVLSGNGVVSMEWVADGTSSGQTKGQYSTVSTWFTKGTHYRGECHLRAGDSTTHAEILLKSPSYDTSTYFPNDSMIILGSFPESNPGSSTEHFGHVYTEYKYSQAATAAPGYGIAPVSLYENESAAFAGSIQLSETSANFTRIELFCKDNDGRYCYTQVFNPNGKTVNVTQTLSYSGNFYVKSRAFSISAKVIDTASTSGTYHTGEVNAAGNNSGSSVDNIKIVKVLGYR